MTDQSDRQTRIFSSYEGMYKVFFVRIMPKVQVDLKEFAKDGVKHLSFYF